MNSRLIAGIVTLAANILLAAPASNSGDPTGPADKTTIEAELMRLPISFEANAGQFDRAVEYVARTDRFSVFLTNAEAVFVDQPRSIITMQFAGASTVDVEGFDRLPGVVHHLTGNDPKGWTTNVPTFGSVRYAKVWPGIDVVFHGRRERLEYDFEVAAGVDHRAIRLAFPGADSLAIDLDGNLAVTKSGVRQLHRVPAIIEDPGGPAARRLSGRFVLQGNDRVGFEVDGRDESRPLLIDPEVVYATPLFGGSDIDNVLSLDEGEDGRVTIAGYTESLDFPGTGPSSYQRFNQSAPPRHAAGVVSRLSEDGRRIEWTTYLSGRSTDFTILWKVRVDRGGFIAVCGMTTATDFPTTKNAFDTVAEDVEGVVAVLTPNGANLVYSTFLGGRSTDSLFGLTVLTDPVARGRSLIAVAGTTLSPDFPLVNPATAPFDHSADTVVAVIDPTGGGLRYSSRIPGGILDEVGLDIDSRGDSLAVTGYTYSTPRPRFVAWHHALESDRRVAQVRASTPAWTGYANRWNQTLTKAFRLPAGQVEATFVARWETEEDFDFLRFRVSADGGATWIDLAELDGFSSGFEPLSVDLSAFAGRSVLLQFQFFSDPGISDQDGGIDTNGSAVDSIAVTGFAPDGFDAGLDGWIPDDIPGAMPAAFTHGPLGGFTDAFIALVKPFESSIRVAVIGGRTADGSGQGGEVSFAPDGTIVALGQTSSLAFPATAGAYRQTLPGLANLWIAKFSDDLSQLLGATYLGGNTGESPNGLAVGADGRILITGISQSPDFPIVDPIDLSPLLGAGGGGHDRDYIFSILSPDLNELVHSSKIGDPGWELGGEVTVGRDGSIYLLGRKRMGGADAGPTQDVFVVKLRQ